MLTGRRWPHQVVLHARSADHGKGGAILCRMGTRVRRGEELAITRTLARLGIPILRTLCPAGALWKAAALPGSMTTAVIGCASGNREGAEQWGEVLKRQGFDLIISISSAMTCTSMGRPDDRQGSRLVDPFGLPYSFLQKLKEPESADR